MDAVRPHCHHACVEETWSDLAERTEAGVMRRFNEQTDARTRERLGMSAASVRDGVLVTVARDPMGGYWNKALGFVAPVTDDLVGEIVARAREAGAPAFGLQVQPSARPADEDALLDAHGLTRGNRFVKCFGPAQPRADVATDGLRIERVGAERADDFGRIMKAGFGVPEESEDATLWFADPGFYDGEWATYAAFDGDEVVAVARLCVVEETGAGAMFGAATLPQARNRGAQGALMDARVREARDRGCRWISAETWAESPGNPNPSQHNMRLAGLTEVHTREDWVWRAG